MPYEFLIEDLNKRLTQKAIGTDKGLAKIGDGVVNLAYSTAKSIYLTNTSTNKIIRTGKKVNKKILATALKNAQMKNFAKNRADAHDLANTVEAIVAYAWFCNKITLKEIIDLLAKKLSGNLYVYREEIESAIEAFTNLLIHIKKYLPEN